MEQYRNDKKWENIAKWSEELGVQPWGKSVVSMPTIHFGLLMGSRLSAQKIIDGQTVSDQYGNEYKNSKNLRVICVASEKTCEFCNADKRFVTFGIRDKNHESNDFLDEVQKAAEQLNKFLTAGLRVLVHCHSGRNRSALIILIYCAMYTKLSYTESLHKIRVYNKSRFPMQSTLKNSSFTSHVRLNWDTIQETHSLTASKEKVQ